MRVSSGWQLPESTHPTRAEKVRRRSPKHFRAASPPTRTSPPRRCLAAALAAALLAGGCSLYRVKATGHPGVADDGAVVWSYAWGLVPGLPEVECPEEATLAEVTVKSHLGFDLLSVVTLGLVSPKRIEWKCTVAPEPGRFPDTEAPDAEASDSADSHAESGDGAR